MRVERVAAAWAVLAAALRHGAVGAINLEAMGLTDGEQRAAMELMAFEAEVMAAGFDAELAAERERVELEELWVLPESEGPGL